MGTRSVLSSSLVAVFHMVNTGVVLLTSSINTFHNVIPGDTVPKNFKNFAPRNGLSAFRAFALFPISRRRNQSWRIKCRDKMVMLSIMYVSQQVPLDFTIFVVPYFPESFVQVGNKGNTKREVFSYYRPTGVW